MKLVLIFVMFIFVEYHDAKDPNIKILKASCRSSQKTCINKAFCEVHQVSRNISLMSFGCDFNRSLNKVFGDSYLGFSKTGNDYRQIVGLKKIEMCEVYDNIAKYPVFVRIVDWLKSTIPNLIHKCPHTTCSCYNVTLDVKKQKKEIGDFYSLFPNGYYKHRVNIYDDDDENVFELTYEMIKRNFQ